jgi:hypothetical protein
MNKQFINNTMMQGAFFSVNKHLAKYLKSNDAALILSHFIYLQEHFFKGTEFYQQQERIMEECNITLAVLRSSMKLLTTKNLLSIKKKGTPAKNYYTINYSEISRILSEQDINLQSSEIMSTSTINTNLQSSEIMSTSNQESPSQRVYKSKVYNKRVDKKEDNNKIDNNIRDKLIKDKLYYPGNKIPQGFKGTSDYLDHLYSQHYK